eukprot:13324797-Alexandrium_andersonii.AAC.1
MVSSSLFLSRFLFALTVVFGNFMVIESAEPVAGFAGSCACCDPAFFGLVQDASLELLVRAWRGCRA